jgi:hypothetical protein
MAAVAVARVAVAVRGRVLSAGRLAIVDAMERTPLADGRSSLSLLAIGSAAAAAQMLVACCIYAGVYRHAVRTGLLAHYSAESAA